MSIEEKYKARTWNFYQAGQVSVFGGQDSSKSIPTIELEHLKCRC